MKKAKECPRAVDVVQVSGRITFSLLDIFRLFFTRKILISTKAFTSKIAGETLHSKVNWSWDE